MAASWCFCLQSYHRIVFDTHIPQSIWFNAPQVPCASYTLTCRPAHSSYMIALCSCLDKSPKSRPNFQDIIKALTEMHSSLLAGFPSLVRPPSRSHAAQGASALALMATATASATAAVGMSPESVGGLAKGWYHGMPSVADMPPVQTPTSVRLPGPPAAWGIDKQQPGKQGGGRQAAEGAAGTAGKDQVPAGGAAAATAAAAALCAGWWVC